MTSYLDADFPTATACKYHCSPSCHPAQVGPEWVYGCTHEAWPQNRQGDFVPIVKCDGNPAKCEIPVKLIKRMITGRYARMRNAWRKAGKVETEIKEMETMLEIRKNNP